VHSLQTNFIDLNNCILGVIPKIYGLLYKSSWYNNFENKKNLGTFAIGNKKGRLTLLSDLFR